MRLKLFVLPLAIFISISAFISYVWPEFELIQKNAKELEAANETLLAAQNRQKNIEGLVGQLDSSMEYEKSVMDYLPQENESHEIINSVEQIVSRSEISLLSIGVSGETTKKPTATAKGKIDAETGVAVTKNDLRLGQMGIKLSVSGEYEKLVEFLKKLDAFKRKSDIMQYAVTMQELEDQSRILIMNVDVSFGYAPQAKLADQQAPDVFEKPQFDFEAIDAYNNKIKEVVTDLDSGQTNGKVNPFSL